MGKAVTLLAEVGGINIAAVLLLPEGVNNIYGYNKFFGKEFPLPAQVHTEGTVYRSLWIGKPVIAQADTGIHHITELVIAIAAGYQ